MSLDRRMRPEDRHRQHAFLQDVQHFHDALLPGLHFRHGHPQLFTHEHSDAGSGQQFLHGLTDADRATLAPTLIKKLNHFFFQCAGVGSDVVIGQPFSNETQLAGACAPVHVIQDLWSEDRHGKFVHLCLIQILIRSEEKFLSFRAHKVDHVHGQKVHLEDAAHLLVTQPDQLHRVFQKLNDWPKEWQAHLKAWRFFPGFPPSPQEQRRND
mmetsp:Transcript_72985/g.89515  ORF Transcript_72985/g.89515 Transcript_72985/m.89515 type:complete len:211 (-) Transcript_72985:130-762(-)